MHLGASICGTPGNSLNCSHVSGLITPSVRTRVIYGRVGYGPISIELLPPITEASGSFVTGTFLPARDQDQDEKALSLIGRTYLESVEEADQDRTSSSGAAQLNFREPLPVWGNASIGAEFTGAQGLTPEPKLLLEGKLSLSAESVSLPGLKPSLYRVTELDLPVGSRVEVSPPASNKKGQDAGAVGLNWWGVVYVDNDKPALTVEVATNEPKLAIYRPNRHEADEIEATVLAQMLGDPHLSKFYALLIALGGFTWLAEALHKHSKKQRDLRASQSYEKGPSKTR